MHKGRPLTNPMMITSTDGNIVSVMGPCFAVGKNSDAYILNNMFKSAEGVVDWLNENDKYLFLIVGFAMHAVETITDFGLCMRCQNF